MNKSVPKTSKSCDRPASMKKQLELELTVDTNELDRLAIGGRLYDMFSWKNGRANFTTILNSDKETKDIVIKESDLLKVIQLVSPGQPDRHIRLVKD